MATWSGSQLVTRREISRTAGPLGERDPNSAWPGQKIISHFCMIWYDLDIMGMGEASISLPAEVYQLWIETEGYQGVDPTYRKLGGQRGMEISVPGCRTENGWVFSLHCPVCIKFQSRYISRMQKLFSQMTVNMRTKHMATAQKCGANGSKVVCFTIPFRTR